MVAPPEGAAHLHNQPKRRIRRQVNLGMWRFPNGGIAQRLQRAFRIRHPLAQNGDFLGRDGKVAAHFLGRGAPAW